MLNRLISNMITAMQSARIKLTNHLVAAREELEKCHHSIAYKDGRARMIRINNMLSEIDNMINELVPNEAADEPEQEF